MKVLLVLSLAVCAWGATLRPRMTTARFGCYDPHDGSWHEVTGGQCHCSDGAAVCELVPGCVDIHGHFVPVGGTIMSGIDHCGCGFGVSCTKHGRSVFEMQRGCSSCFYDGNSYDDGSHFTNSLGGQCHCSCGQATCGCFDDGNNYDHDSDFTDSMGHQCHCVNGQAICIRTTTTPEPTTPVTVTLTTSRPNVATCEVSPCVYGTCTDGVWGYTCTCESGWEGFNCDQNIDECASSPCTHSTCTDLVANYTCSCENGWTGHDCDQDIDECASNPCLLGGTCLDHVDGYSCVCPKDATGKNCDTVPFIGECYQFSTSAVPHRDATQACSTNNGRMVDLKDEQQQQFLANTIAATTNVSNWLAMKTAPLPILYSDGSPVIAPLQWSAGEPSSPLDMCVLLDSSDSYNAKTAFCTEQHNYVCQDELKPCEPNVCQNGGNCTSCFGGSTTFCDCLDGFEGKLCEINTDECESDPCQHGGTCQDQVNSYSCRCPTGYSGDNCETEIDWCAMVTCPFDWTCQNLITHFSCLAPIVRMLEPYKCSSASCPGDMYCREDSDTSFSCWAN